MKKILSALLALTLVVNMFLFSGINVFAVTTTENNASNIAETQSSNNPSETSITSVKANENGFDVTVSKVDDATGYQVRYATRSDFGNAKTDTYPGVDDTTLTVKNRAYDTTYNVQARTYKIVGSETYYSDWSETKQATTVSMYPGETSITSVKANGNGFDVTVSKAANANGYEVRYATRSDFGNAKTNSYDSVDDTTLTVTGRAYDTPYNVQARAYKIVDGDKYYSDWTASKQVTTAKNPNCPAPTDITSIKVNENTFDVTVSKVADATGYQVRYATRSDFGNAKTDTYPGVDDTTLTVKNRAYGTTYNVQVRTYKTVGNETYYSDWSDAGKATTVSMYPSSVSVTSVKANGNGFDVTVSKATNANGYEVRYATRSDFGNAKTNSYDSVDDTTLTVTGRAYDTPYNVQVRAYKITVDGDKYYSAWTSSKQVTTAKNPNCPAPTDITSIKVNENTFDVSVTKVTDATGYQVRYATRSDFGNAKTDTHSGTENTILTVKNRAYGTTYNVQVRTYKTVGNETYYSDWSDAGKATTVSVYPGSVSITSLKANENGFDVTVSKATNANGYEVRYATRSDFGNAKTNTYDSVDNTTLTVKNRAYDTPYYVQARAYKITVDGDKYYSDWSSSKQVTTAKDPYIPSATTLSTVTGIVNGFDVSWKAVSGVSGYEIQYATKSDFSNGASQTASGTATSKTITGRAGGTKYYVRIRVYNTVDGWNHYSDWSSAKTVTTITSFEDDLRKAGFPESYIPALVELHEKYPNWVFEPFKTGLNWNSAVNGERSPHSQQKIQVYYGNNGKGYYCTCSKCYVNGDYVIQEKPNWVSASQKAVEYYMDPRNFLNEQEIFQFESIFNKGNQTTAGVEAILKGTWMYNSTISYKDSNGATKTINKKYSQAILEASNQSGLSAYYIASKIVQEVGGASPTAGGASGTVSGYKGIYNYYNIYAYTGDTDGLKWASSGGYYTNCECRVRQSPTTNSAQLVMLPANTTVTVKSETSKQPDGYTWYQVSVTYGGKTYNGYIRSDLVDADSYNRPWTDPYKSIINGAKWIANNYEDQFNGYLQKFNVNSASGQLYEHEYMANVQAAASEAKKTYNGYKSANILDSKIVFSIPVFNDMP